MSHTGTTEHAANTKARSTPRWPPYVGHILSTDFVTKEKPTSLILEYNSNYCVYIEVDSLHVALGSFNIEGTEKIHTGEMASPYSR